VREVFAKLEIVQFEDHVGATQVKSMAADASE
jgi:hypothetical protein